MKIITALFLFITAPFALAGEPTSGTLIELSGIGVFVLLSSAYSLKKRAGVSSKKNS